MLQHTASANTDPKRPLTPDVVPEKPPAGVLGAPLSYVPRKPGAFRLVLPCELVRLPSKLGDLCALCTQQVPTKGTEE